jgi:type IV pilus assembly protein PilW
MMRMSRFAGRGYQKGVSIIETMVALVIGMIAAIVVMQVFSFFEGQRRSTTSGADAQTNGAIALYSIGRDLQAAGYGLMPAGKDSPLECNPEPSIGAISISPVVVTNGATATDSDVIAIRSGGSAMAGVPTAIRSVAGLTATVDNNFGCAVNDAAVLMNHATCNMTTVTALPGLVGITLQSAAGAAANVNIACLGAWVETRYDVVGNFLRVNGVPTVPGVVNMQAQYGVSAQAQSNVITEWVDASGATWAAPSVANRNRIKAVRVAIVARSNLLERDIVSNPCSSVTAANPSGVCAWDATTVNPAAEAPAIDLSNTADWRRYRYRVFETIIPLRNMVWSREAFQ